MADIYEAISVPARRTILDELYARDGQTLFELCGRLTMKHGMGLSRQAISQHLAVLESVGLVSVKREGRYKYHFMHTMPLKEITSRWPSRKGKRT
jgi:DNA-binding transcriptional ArsR family regulator